MYRNGVISEKQSPILGSDNNKEVQILSVIRNQYSLALGIVQIFAQIDAETFSTFLL